MIVTRVLFDSETQIKASCLESLHGGNGSHPFQLYTLEIDSAFSSSNEI